jgi:hypothetical protein
MEDAAQNRVCERWDRLTLLLIAQAREGWAHEFEEITCREIGRLAIPAAVSGEGDEQPSRNPGRFPRRRASNRFSPDICGSAAGSSSRALGAGWRRSRPTRLDKAMEAR